MNAITLTLNENILKIMVSDNNGVRGASIDISKDIADDSKILDPAGFGQKLKALVLEINEGKNLKLPINYVVEPSEVMLSFVTVNKRDGNPDEQVLAAIKTKLKNLSLEDFYFAYQKIAPFVYQFVAIKKETLESIIQACNEAGFALNSVTPWVLLLPKLLGTNEPSIFVSKNNKNEIISLSELGGIYYCETFQKELNSKDFEKLVHDLSVYKRSVPINKIYTFKHDMAPLESGYDIIPLVVPGDETTGEESYEVHRLFNYLADTNSEIFKTQANLLNLLPLPAVEKKNTALVYVGASVASLVLIVGAVSIVALTKNSAGANQSDVLGSEQAPESTQSTSSQSEQIPATNLERKDLKIRVENGAGITGIAGKARDFLVSKGYTVTDIGNFEGETKQTTLVSFKKSKIQYKDMLVKDLEGSYTVTTDENLADTTAHDVLIIVGVK